MNFESRLYSVKWYKGRHEFYRYMPGNQPKIKTFPVKGMKINVSCFGGKIPFLWRVFRVLFSSYISTPFFIVRSVFFLPFLTGA